MVNVVESDLNLDVVLDIYIQFFFINLAVRYLNIVYCHGEETGGPCNPAGNQDLLYGVTMVFFLISLLLNMLR